MTIGRFTWVGRWVRSRTTWALVWAREPKRAGLVVGAAGMVGAAGACADLHSCDDDRRPRPPAVGVAPLASVARWLQVDANALDPGVDPPALAGDFESEVERFSTVDACVKEHAGIDPLVGDALEAIGYETFLRDACRVLDAAKAKDGRRCEAIDASSLRARCVATVAEILGAADACPWEAPDRPTRGRDPLCVAIASHDTRLCAALRTAAARASCEAMAAPDDTPCAGLTSTVEQERCARNAHRWRNALARAATSSVATPARSGSPVGAGELRIEVDDAGPPTEESLASELEHGVVVIEQRDGARFVIGPLSESGLGFVVPAPAERATIALQLFVRGASRGATVGAGSPSGATSPGRANAAIVERVELVVPGRAPLGTPLAHSALVATLDELEAVRGGAVRFSLEGAIENASGHFEVHVRGATFVRDVVKASAIYAVASPPLGGDGGMR